MRPEESSYWDEVATSKGVGGNPSDFNDNIWKRCEIVRRILEHRPINARVLEIGCGHGLTPNVVKMATLGNFRYTGTDVSPKFCEFMKDRFGMDAVNTDILKLPDGPFDMIWAFDTLEHVRPEDREAGYKEIDRVLSKENGVILLNLPRDESGHDEKFDWGVGDQDVAWLASIVKGRIFKMEHYHIEEIGLSYSWVEIRR